MLTSEQIDRLLSQQSISGRYPWNANNEQMIDDFYRSVCAEVSLKTQAKSVIEWDHYGSGYASYIGAWFYKTTPEFDMTVPQTYGKGHRGLVVLLSRLSPYFVFAEGEKNWHSHGGGSHLPAFEMVDCIQSSGVTKLVTEVQPILEEFGLVRLLRESLMQPLETTRRVPTILTDEPFTHFDALYYWED
jgi:hypothetical protein